MDRITPYMRLMRFHRMLPILLGVFPAIWGLCLAAEGRPTPQFLAIFILLSLLMRSAGCIINDVLDRKIDAQVARTRMRPLAAGTVSVRGALILAGGLVWVSANLFWFLNTLTRVLGAVAFAGTLLYPLAKRFVAIPQLVLGVAYNFGFLLAYAAVRNTLSAEALLWFGLSILWTLVYDTQYALNDREDDARIGVRSSALLFGRHVGVVLRILQAGIVVYLAGLVWTWYTPRVVMLLPVLGVALAFWRQQRLVRDGEFLRAFDENGLVGCILFLAIVLRYPPALPWN